MKHSLRASLVLAFTSLGIGTFLACSGDDPIADNPGTDSGADGNPGTGDSSTPGVDAGEDAGEPGGNPIEDPDGGIDEDAGYDAGPACSPVTVGDYSQTTCGLSLLPAGGTLTTATYVLESVKVNGAAKFCSGQYIPFDYRGGLEVVASSPTTATFDFYELHKRSTGTIGRPTPVRWNANVTAEGISLSFAATACTNRLFPKGKSAFTTGTSGGKKTLTVALPISDTANALFRFVEP